MKRIAELLFEARMLRHIPRSGFQFLGVGRESVAEHVYSTTFIAYTMAQMHPELDRLKLMSMCLVHDLPEARTGDLNSVQKAYVSADEQQAVADALDGVAFADELRSLLEEYACGSSPEAQLARDADQISLIIELKDLKDIGHRPPDDWLPHVLGRLRTPTGKALAQAVLDTRRDSWWWAAAAARESI
jgi:putative hydrolase of HD superfamily